MLIPLTRQTLEQVIPVMGTGPQYNYCWGTWQDFLRRLLISLVAVVVFWLLGYLFGDAFQTVKLILDIIAGLYWLWGPAYLATLRNNTYRRYPYGGFWRGRVLDAYITEELIGEKEAVDKRGELIVIENRERRINVQVGDNSGFTTRIQAPLKRIHKSIRPGAVAELIVLSQSPDLSTFAKLTDIYLPEQNLWIGEYPYLRRDIFTQMSQDIGKSDRVKRRVR